jgi:hypothetical protein
LRIEREVELHGREPRTRSNRRMDVVVFYGREKFIVELKIWRGEKY